MSSRAVGSFGSRLEGLQALYAKQLAGRATWNIHVGLTAVLERHLDRAVEPEPMHAVQLCHEVADALAMALPSDWRHRGNANYSERLECLLALLWGCQAVQFEKSKDALLVLFSDLYDWAGRSRIRLD